MRIGIYGGTFDPIHKGHLAAAKTVIEMLALDRLLLIPAAIPPHKALQAKSASTEHRLAMTCLAAESMLKKEVEVSDIEMRRSGPSYTVDTLRELKETYGDAELWLLMGTDMLESFLSWREPEEILRLAGVCAFGRNAEDTERSLSLHGEKLKALVPQARLEILTLPNLVEISSTEVRAGLADGRAEEYLVPAVHGYILRHGLYGTEVDLKNLSMEDLRSVAMSYLHARRIPHVLGTEETAVRLAQKYGVDETAARQTALLHDCTKRLAGEEQLELCERYGVELDEMEKQEAKLLHAKTGAAIAREVFGMSEEVVSAICWHTTGKANMTKLEKVIYLADYIEPNRKFPGVEELREATERDLDEGLELGLSMTVKEMRERGNSVHIKTLEALAYLKGQKI